MPVTRTVEIFNLHQRHRHRTAGRAREVCPVVSPVLVISETDGDSATTMVLRRYIGKAKRPCH
ncbi:hypothetical protein BGW80DRAFT_1311981 [Lactifluus volemus]|nr:hypothetical protein BGW80DRAFT_1311981 [Lactifluus volemus]